MDYELVDLYLFMNKGIELADLDLSMNKWIMN